LIRPVTLSDFATLAEIAVAAFADPSLSEVTIAQLLYHQGGWDIEELRYDPMSSDFRISKSLGVSLPTSQADIITSGPGEGPGF